MKIFPTILTIILIILLTLSQPTNSTPTISLPSPKLPSTLLLETDSSLQRAGNFLLTSQQQNGSWSNNPLITAWAMLALKYSPYATEKKTSQATKKARKYLNKCSHKDGSITTPISKEYPILTTAITIIALSQDASSKDIQTIKKAYKYLINQQTKTSKPNYGGFPYTPNSPANLVATSWVIEALHFSQTITKTNNSKIYQKQETFIQHCLIQAKYQNTPQSQTKKHKTYSPPSPTLYTALAAKTLLYTNPQPNTPNPKITKALNYITNNYPLNPNYIKNSDIYTSLFTIAKLLRQSEKQNQAIPIKLQNWRTQMVKFLLSHQKGDGSWQHKKSQWLETKATITTAYSMMILELTAGSDLYSKPQNIPKI